MIASEDAARAFAAGLCDAPAMARLTKLTELLAEENRQQNLVAAASLADLWRRHIADSLQLLGFVPRETTGSWLDLGTGAGFPGLAIAAARPDLRVIMVESRRRRCEWLTEACESLGLGNAEVLHSRLELVDTLEAAVISARAFAPLPKLLSLSARFSTSDTRWALPKGRSARQELEALPKRVARMFHVEQSLTDPEAGIIVGQGKPELRA